ncbi:MAG: type II toxin-antitoxin system VapC family toxin [Peptococcaceae bacterium]|nr:MAG: type II toxin-antitoxin system VapC family toxin [Peptococcaceae bacterium]
MILKKEISGLLLDTDFLIDLNRSKRNHLRARAEKLLFDINAEDLFISSIVVTEFLTGVPRDLQEPARKMLQELYFYVALTYEEAVLAGELRREWRSKGHTLAISDVTNAALAISRNLAMVTRNVSHYPFPQLEIKSW